jgi:hypothetical protein
MKPVLERIILLCILLGTTYYNLKLGLIVCFVIIVIYLQSKPCNTEGFDIDKENDCNVIKIPEVQVMTTTNYTAIMVEPRKHRALEFVMRNFTDNLDNNWNFMIYHGSDNKQYLENIVKKLSADVQSRITLINLKVSNINIRQYSTMFFCPTFYNNIPTETFLIFQTDSMILKENKDKIKDFLKYDYVGAPWPKTMGILGKMQVGNGGLSLRKKSKMVELLKYKNKGIQNGYYGKYVAEDQFFCGYFTPEVEIYKPTFVKAKEFSIEAVYSENPFGVHKLWTGLTPAELNNMIKKYPDIATLIQLNQ